MLRISNHPMLWNYINKTRDLYISMESSKWNKSHKYDITFCLPALNFSQSMRDFVVITSSATSNDFEESPSIILTTSCGVVNIGFLGSGCYQLHQNIPSFRCSKNEKFLWLCNNDYVWFLCFIVCKFSHHLRKQWLKSQI